MTTVMLIAAMIPIALGRGAGSGSRASLAKVVLGGQTLSLLLTLLVTPVAYTIWDDVGQLFFKIIGRQKAPLAEVQPRPAPEEPLDTRPAPDKPDRKKHREKVPTPVSLRRID